MHDSPPPGFRYACQRCGACCQWPGDVILTNADIDRLAEFFQLPVEDFIQRHTRLSANRRHLSLLDQEDGSCIHYDATHRACRIQAAKPEQCSGFPNTWNFPGWRDKCEAILTSAAPTDSEKV